MSESLVVIRTFHDLLDADRAQVDLLSAGIYSLIMAEGDGVPPYGASRGIGLAVHERDVEVAEAVLLEPPDPE